MSTIYMEVYLNGLTMGLMCMTAKAIKPITSMLFLLNGANGLKKGIKFLINKDTNNNKELAFSFHFPTSKKALIIFTRNPELGKCKTRLAKSIGDEAALTIYKYLLQHTAIITAPVSADKFVFYSENILENDIRS